MLHGELFESCLNSPKISTHSHHYPDSYFTDISLEKLLADAYVSWCGVPVGDGEASHKAYIDKVCCNSYFVYLRRALQALYGMDEPLSAQNWERYDRVIREQYQDAGWRASILRDHCLYRTSFLDAYWKPGDDGGDRSLFTPVVRINPYLLAYDKEKVDHDGNNVWTLHQKEFSSAEDFLTFYEGQLRSNIADGCRAIKCASAYDRGLIFHPTPYEAANRVFTSKNYTQADECAFQDYVVDHVCEIAADLDVPLQWHTGLACLHDTGAMALLTLIERHPRTKFVLFHGGYPWLHETAALMHNFTNVYADLVWLPILSPTAAVETLHGLLEIGTADRICWGCDAKIPEESYGACIAIADVLSTTLSQKVEDGYLTNAEADMLAQNILWRNAQILYKL